MLVLLNLPFGGAAYAEVKTTVGAEGDAVVGVRHEHHRRQALHDDPPPIGDAGAPGVAQCLDLPGAGDIELVAVPGQTQQQGEPIGEALDAVNLAGSLAICGDPERAADVANVQLLIRALC